VAVADVDEAGARAVATACGEPAFAIAADLATAEGPGDMAASTRTDAHSVGRTSDPATVMDGLAARISTCVVRRPRSRGWCHLAIPRCRGAKARQVRVTVERLTGGADGLVSW
jgi:hypothetical protein